MPASRVDGMRAVAGAAFGFGWAAAFAGAFLLAGSASLVFERARPLSEQGAWWGAGIVALAALVLTGPVMVGAALWTADDESVDAGRAHAALLAALLAVMAGRMGGVTEGFPDPFAPHALLGILLAVLATELGLLNVAATRRGGHPAGTPFVFPGLAASLVGGYALGALA